MSDYRHVRSGSLTIPTGPGTPGAKALPRSPPNTSHVPCKFFRQGACQAGNACPFSHDLGASADTVCKYFAKGNCKFGPKCANIHVLPDGRRISYSRNGVTIGGAPIISLSGRPSPRPTSPLSSASAIPHRRDLSSALTSSLYRADQQSYLSGIPGENRSSLYHQHHQHHNLFARQPSLDDPLSAMDMPRTQPTYGSPRDDDAARFAFGFSPMNGKGLSVLDAPLPASFDSNGISNAARFPSAPWPSSVPSKFGFESPTPSMSSFKDARASEALKLLHTSSFGSSEYLAIPAASGSPSSNISSGEEFFGRRAMHSLSRSAKPKLLSSSLPKSELLDRDWEADLVVEEDGDNAPENYLPENLQDLLTPAEKARRRSMRADSDPALDGFPKYGSPLGSSPSRWGSLFQRQKEEEEAARAMRSAGSAFGHVGSPLRRSTLAKEMSDAMSRTSNPVPSQSLIRPTASPPGNRSMSVLSQQLQRSRLEESKRSADAQPDAPPVGSEEGVSEAGEKDQAADPSSGPALSSPPIARLTTPIDEEDPAFVFSMEKEDDSGAARTRKRPANGLTINAFPSYASAAAAAASEQTKKTGQAGSGTVPVNGL